MTMFRTLGIAAAMLASTAASATIVKVTLTGTNENINDTSGVFGAPGGRITNTAFTQVFTINTLGGNVVSSPTAVSYNSIFGTLGQFAVGGDLTINGHSFITKGDNYSAVFTGPDYQILSDDLPNSANPIFSLDLHGTGLPASITAPASLTIGGGLSAIDSFIDYRPATGEDSQGTLVVSNVTIAAVPEPASLGLAVLGFGALALRTRRR